MRQISSRIRTVTKQTDAKMSKGLSKMFGWAVTACFNVKTALFFNFRLSWFRYETKMILRERLARRFQYIKYCYQSLTVNHFRLVLRTSCSTLRLFIKDSFDKTEKWWSDRCLPGVNTCANWQVVRSNPGQSCLSLHPLCSPSCARHCPRLPNRHGPILVKMCNFRRILHPSPNPLQL